MENKRPADGFYLTKQQAAEEQLETALNLWFHYAPPVAVLALANAAYECYDALAFSPDNSPYKEWLRNEPQARQDRVRKMVNFIKHGRIDLKGKIPFMPIVAESMMMDAIESYQRIHSHKTQLMTLFLARWAIENASRANEAVRTVLLAMTKSHDLQHRDRTQFLDECRKRLGARDR